MDLLGFFVIFVLIAVIIFFLIKLFSEFPGLLSFRCVVKDDDVENSDELFQNVKLEKLSRAYLSRSERQDIVNKVGSAKIWGDKFFMSHTLINII